MLGLVMPMRARNPNVANSPMLPDMINHIFYLVHHYVYKRSYCGASLLSIVLKGQWHENGELVEKQDLNIYLQYKNN
jgi:hypothetical protein